LTNVTELAARSAVVEAGADVVDDRGTVSLVVEEGAVVDVVVEVVEVLVVDVVVLDDVVDSGVLDVVDADGAFSPTSTRGPTSGSAAVVTLGPSAQAAVMTRMLASSAGRASARRCDRLASGVRPRRVALGRRITRPMSPTPCHSRPGIHPMSPTGRMDPSVSPTDVQLRPGTEHAPGQDGSRAPTVAAVDNVAVSAGTTLREASPAEPAAASADATYDAAAQRMFSTAMVVSGVRCMIAYVLLPFVAPAVGLASSVGPGVGVVVGTVAIGANILTIRRFHLGCHRWRWHITAISGCVLALLVVLMVRDVSALL
jgi:hypothetical protein